MEKRSSNIGKSIVDQVEPKPPAGVWLKSNYPDKSITIGSVTGKRYEFLRGGSVVEVDISDVPEMLKKVYGGYSCCGSGATPVPMFTVVE